MASTLTPESTNVRGYRYDPDGQQLFVTFKSGSTYRYDDVPPGVARSLGRNKSAGRTINRLVKAKGYSYEKVAGNLRDEVARALLTRKLRGRAVRDIPARSLLKGPRRARGTPPPVPDRGNNLAPISGEFETKFGGGKGLKQPWFAKLVDAFRHRPTPVSTFASQADLIEHMAHSRLRAIGERPRRPATKNVLSKIGWEDRLPGGLADAKTPSNFSPTGLAQGVKVELEHTSDPRLATEVAMDHLTEDKAYYDKLKKIEKRTSGDTKPGGGLIARP